MKLALFLSMALLASTAIANETATPTVPQQASTGQPLKILPLELPAKNSMAILAKRPTINMKVISFMAVPVGNDSYRGIITVDFGDGRQWEYKDFETLGVVAPVQPCTP